MSVAGFAAIPNAVLHDETLSSGAKLTLLALSSFSGYDEIFPSRATLAKLTGLGERSIHRHLVELRERELIEWKVVTTKTGRMATYRLMTPWQGGHATVAVPPGGVVPPWPDGSGHSGTTGTATVAGDIDKEEVDRQEITKAAQPKQPRKQRKPKTPLPGDWQPADSHREYAREHGFDLSLEAARFRSFHLSKGNEYADWGQAFWTWLHNQVAWSKPGNRADDTPSRPRRMASEVPLPVLSDNALRERWYDDLANLRNPWEWFDEMAAAGDFDQGVLV